MLVLALCYGGVLEMSDKVSTSITLEAENREYLDREVNNRSAFINDLIEAHRQGKSDIDEAIARYRRQQLQSELNTVESRKEEIENELDLINKQVQKEEARKQEMLAEAKHKLSDIPHSPDNPAVENWAEKLDMTPEELIEELGDDDE